MGPWLCSPGVSPRGAARPWEQELPSLRGPRGLGRPGPGAVRPLTPRLSPASTLSQLSDSGQTLSEDSGVDIGEVETSGKDKSRQPGPGKSRSLKEATRSEGAAEGASKPVRGAWGAALCGRGLCPTAWPAPSTPSAHRQQPLLGLSWDVYPEAGQFSGGLSCGERGQERPVEQGHSILGKSHPSQIQQAAPWGMGEFLAPKGHPQSS